eukprot:3347898-Alexandrium_andersonii.AAC.1
MWFSRRNAGACSSEADVVPNGSAPRNTDACSSDAPCGEPGNTGAFHPSPGGGCGANVVLPRGTRMHTALTQVRWIRQYMNHGCMQM